MEERKKKIIELLNIHAKRTTLSNERGFYESAIEFMDGCPGDCEHYRADMENKLEKINQNISALESEAKEIIYAIDEMDKINPPKKDNTAEIKSMLELEIEKLVLGMKTQHVLISGGPGTGKTQILDYIAGYAKAKGVEVKGFDVRSVYVNGDAMALKKMAEDNSKQVVFQEELDSALCGRSDVFDAEFKKYLSKDNVIFVGTTNCPEKIEEAVKQRMYHVETRK